MIDKNDDIIGLKECLSYTDYDYSRKYESNFSGWILKNHKNDYISSQSGELLKYSDEQIISKLKEYLYLIEIDILNRIFDILIREPGSNFFHLGSPSLSNYRHLFYSAPDDLLSSGDSLIVDQNMFKAFLREYKINKILK